MSDWVPVPSWGQKDKRTFSKPADDIPGKIEDRFDSCQEFAEDRLDDAQDLMNSMENFLSDLETPDENLVGLTYPHITPLDYESRPSLGDVDLPDIPTSTVVKPAWEQIPSFDELEFPAFNVNDPNYQTVTKPSHTAIAAPGDGPTPATITYPATPDIDIPDPPSLEDIIFPAAPSITIPEFEGEVPTETWNTPASFSYEEAEYSSDVWADLLAKVMNDIRNGGTGLGALVEAELFARALARQETENERLYQEIEDYFEARGFDLPPGAMAGRLAEAAREISRNNTRINAEITISQAELAQKNTQFMVDKGIQLEGMLRDFFNQQAIRAFEAAKIVAQIGIEIYNAQVNKFNARVSLYQTQGAIFESRVKAALTQAEIYKSQIEACRVMSDVQKNLVEIYKNKIEALDTVIKLYSAEMEAAKIKSEVEKIKLELFNLQIQTYTARVGADKIKFDIYVSEMEGERTKAMIYSEQVNAFLARINAVKVKADVQSQTADLALKTNQIQSENYRAELAGYEAEVKAAVAEINALVEGFRVEALAYGAETEAEGTKFTAMINEMNLSVSAARLSLDKAIARVRASVDSFSAVKALQAAGITGLMNVGAQLAASAMNALNAHASLGYSQSGSESESWGHSDSVSESHPYEEESA